MRGETGAQTCHAGNDIISHLAGELSLHGFDEKISKSGHSLRVGLNCADLLAVHQYLKLCLKQVLLVTE